MTDNIVTQVSPDTNNAFNQNIYDDYNSGSESGNVDYNSKIHLDLRGEHFTITRDELMSLPESILLCLFPNGVFLDEEGQVITNLTEKDIVFVNFDPQCFQYIINKFGEAQHDLLEMGPLSPQVSSGLNRNSQENVLQNKPAIIVLREDLDYYVIPPVAGLNADKMRLLKLNAGEQLLNNEMIFSGLGYNTHLPISIKQELGPAEQHLFDMLCTSGFEPRGTWGCRNMEPSKCIILSLLLVRLKTHSDTPPDSPSLNPVQSNVSTSSRSRSRFATLASNASRAASRSLSRTRKPQNANQTKLLLFWRKPARKCWWSSESISIDLPSEALETSEQNVSVRVHIRRVWTLELSVIGVQ
ncbi:uncharacterized protein PRCAT00001813001 [Priceomyces carsonii]|uniref:uncharacterized protein n=1 Tax=Priceomyces carsonii TaxID=28549 RepID=UPI002ED8C261|nr:unnamed protein product [Priceomyces carsonii]